MYQIQLWGTISLGSKVPFLRRSENSATAVKRTSLELFSAVSQASSRTLMMKPTPTTCMAMSLLIPKEAQATGIRRREPPATPEAPQAPTVEIRHRRSAVGRSTTIPNVLAADKASTEMVMEAVTAAKNAGVTLYCGEFGVIDQAPVEDTLRWFTDVDTVLRQFGIGCAVWTYKEMDFGLIGEHYAPIREQLLKLWNRK